MYQFTTTTVINSNLDSNGSTAKFTGTATALKVTRVATLLKANIVDIYKRPYAAGVKEVAQAQIPAVTAGTVIRLTVDVRLSQQSNSEYANTYLYFKKPVVVEVLATGTAATDAAALVAQLNNFKTEFGYAYVTAAVVSTDYVQVTATDNNQKIFAITVEKENTSTNSIVQPTYTDVTGSTFSVTTPGKIGFGDDDWMIRAIQIPTLENQRYFTINKEERPVLGGNYSQYTVRYKVLKDSTDGISGGVDYSITTHVFYVKSDLVTAFESALTTVAVPFTVTITAGGSTTLSTGADATVQLTATNFVGTVTWTSDQPTRATVDSTGLVTTAGVTGTGAVVITATDSVGNTATESITVTA